MITLKSAPGFCLTHFALSNSVKILKHPLENQMSASRPPAFLLHLYKLYAAILDVVDCTDHLYAVGHM